MVDDDDKKTGKTDGLVLGKEEWEIVKIVGNKRGGNGYEYKVC